MDSLDRSRSVALVVNAGGQSRRMGESKALLRTPVLGKPLIVHVIDQFVDSWVGRHVDEIVVISNDPVVGETLAAAESVALEWIPFVVISDETPGWGPLGGLLTGLRHTDRWSAVVACDMPLLEMKLWHYMLGLGAEVDLHGGDRWDAVVPIARGHFQTLHALYHPRVLPAIQAQLEGGNLRMQDFLQKVRVRMVEEAEARRYDPALRSFTNVNTPEEWVQVRGMLAKDYPDQDSSAWC